MNEALVNIERQGLVAHMAPDAIKISGLVNANI